MKIKNIKNIKNKRIVFLILAVLFTCSMFFSCGDSNNGSGGSQDNIENIQEGQMPETDLPPAEAEEEYTLVYIFPDDMDGGGADFTFLTSAETWFYYTHLTREEITGDILDDAIYNRNRFIEEQFNIEIKAVERDIGNVNRDLRRMVAAGDDIYDAAFCPAFWGGNVGTLITENMLHNLYDIPTMNLDRDWYNQTMLGEAAIGNGRQIYYVGCDINIMTVQSVVFIYFNQDMMADLGIELPYNAVREGRWTYDMFFDYMRAGANLNGAASFDWDPGGPAVYGFSAHGYGAVSLFEGSGERFVTAGSDGTPQLAVGGERFLNVLSRIEDMLVNSPDGYYAFAQDGSTGFHYESLFQNSRAFMITGELKAADVFRGMDTTFGIAPIPKFDIYQQGYYCPLTFATPVLVIPSTNRNPDFTGAVLDAMAYLSARDVTPVLFDVSVSQKMLRNEDSIEMLQIIKNSGSFDVGSAYGWTTDFFNAIAGTLGHGRAFDAVSEIERTMDRMNANIERTMEFFN
jgi:ABC-type glycerol-3-phosphate transport system substrate-binding protein